MKKLLTSALVLLCIAASAQPGRPGRPAGGRYPGYGGYGAGPDIPVYWSVLAGWNFSHISSDGAVQDASGTKTGSFVGMGVGLQVLPAAPVIFNTGLVYSGKGGVSRNTGEDIRYNLGYLELPLSLSYRMMLSPNFAVEPSFGAYLAGGISGKIKNYTTQTSESAFNDFRRFDSGLRLGCGINFLIFHARIAYDLGLADIHRDDFISARNRTLSLAFGLSF